MVDTARSVAALKTLMADNDNGALTEQVIRDFVESIANPVQGGGFPAFSPRYQDYGFDYWGSAYNLSVPNGAAASTVAVFDPAVSGSITTDPMDILEPNAMQRGASAGYALPAYSCLLLRPGLWMYSIRVYWAPNAVGDRIIFPYVGWQDDFDDDPSIDPFFGNPVYANVMGDRWIVPASILTASNSRQFHWGFFFVPESPTYGNVNFTIHVGQTSGGPLNISTFEHSMTFLGP